MLKDRVVPDGLAAMPPGPELAAALAGIELSQVPNQQIGEVLVAQQRMLSHQQARLWATMVEVGRCAPFVHDDAVVRLRWCDPYAAEEIRSALLLTRRSAEYEHGRAETVVGELPAVFAALSEGAIDRARVRVLTDHLAGLTAAQIEAICAIVLPIAGTLTTGELAARLARMVIAVDPTAAQRRHRKAVRDRTVIVYLGADGTATVSATGLSPDEAAAGARRLNRLARAARRAGHPGTYDQIRADIFAGLYDGTLHGLSTEQMITVLVERVAADPDRARAPEDAGPDEGGRSETGRGESRPGPGGPEPGGDGPQDAPGSAGTQDSGRPAETHDDDADRGEVTTTDPTIRADGRADPTDPNWADPTGTDPNSSPDSPPDSADRPGSRGDRHPAPPLRPQGEPDGGPAAHTGIHLRVELSTLLGLDEHPAEIPGLGPVLAHTARAVLTRQRRAEWRFALTDDHGRLLCDGVTRRRPSGLDRNGPSGGTVDLLVPVGLLAELSDHPAWAGVAADLAARYRSGSGHLARLDDRPGARFAHAALRRHVQLRDQVCVRPGCRAPAVGSDLDHTVDHAAGGPSVSTNSGPLCRHDHTVKQRAGWHLEQPEPGTFRWTSPRGRTYHVRPEPIIVPLPAPVPGEPDSFDDEPAPPSPPELIIHRPARPAPERAPPAADPDEPPPF